MKEHVCDICWQKFEKHLLMASHIRWKHYDQVGFGEYMSKLKKDFYNKKLGFVVDFKVKCENCGTDFIVKERELKFPLKEKYYCCVSCANSKNHNVSHSEETKNKLREISKKLWSNPEYAKKCLNNKQFSSIGEREIRKILKEKYGNENVSSHRIVNFKNIKKAVDLTIKNKNIIIEYDGVWHFDKTVYERFGTPEKYFEVIEKDKVLKEYCNENNIKLLRVGDKYYHHNRRKTLLEIIDFIENSELSYKELY